MPSPTLAGVGVTPACGTGPALTVKRFDAFREPHLAVTIRRPATLLAGTASVLVSFDRRRSETLAPLRSKRTVSEHFFSAVPRIVILAEVPAVTTAGVTRTVSFLRFAASAAIGDSARTARQTNTILL